MVRPVYSTTVNVSPANPNYGSYAGAAQAFFFENPQTFQLLSPGLDGLYGEMADSTPANDPTIDAPVYFQVDGSMIQLDPTQTDADGLKSSVVSRFDVSAVVSSTENPFKDNLANFIDGAFEDELD